MTNAKLRQLFASNLQRRMDASSDLNSDPKLEARSGVGKSTIHRYRHARSSPTLDHVEEIARAFGCQPWELLVDPNTAIEDIVRRLLGR